MQNLTLIPNSKAKLKKNTTKKLFTKNCPFASFFKINLYFSQFLLQIWNENKILCILVPTLTYLDSKYFFQNTAQIFFSQVIWVQKNEEFYAYSKSEIKLRKSEPLKSYLKKTSKKSVFYNNFFVMVFS